MAGIRAGAALTATFLVFLTPVQGLAVSDSLPVSGRWQQGGATLPRRSLEKLLLETPGSMADADASKGSRGAGIAIGATLFCVDAAVTAVQVVRVINAFESGDYVSTSFDTPILTLSIGGSAVGLLQSRLIARADYLLHRSTRAFNESLDKRNGIRSDRVLLKRGGSFSQGGLSVSSETVLHVLREERVSRGGAVRSVVYRESSVRCATVGASLLAIAVIGLIEGYRDNTKLGWGIGLTSFSIVNSIAAAVARKTALKRYNEAVSAPPAPQ